MPGDMLAIGDVEVAPGESVIIDLPVASLYSHAPMTLPVQVLRGRSDGPHLFVSAALHPVCHTGRHCLRLCQPPPLPAGSPT
jgi:hypothetical protein